MQTLGLSDSTPKPENRLKSLFWPTIRHEVDVDYVTTQGFWICTVVALTTLVLGLFAGAFPGVTFDAVFFFLGGAGVRQRSRVAAVAVFLTYLLSGAVRAPMRIIFLAVLLANVRGTWLSARWRPTATEPPPLPLNHTLVDKISDRLPMHLWPFAKWLFYPMTAVEVGFLVYARLIAGI